MRRRIVKSRHIAAVCVVLIFFSALVGDLVKLQIIDGDSYAEAVSSVSSRTATITAARGEIVDTNGNKLVYNEQSYSIVFNASYFPSEQEKRNEIIISLIRLFEDNGLEWIDNVPLVYDSKGVIQFKEDSDSLIKQMKSRNMLNLNGYATAEECYNALIEEFELESFDKYDARKVASVCFEMMRQEFSVSAPYTFAEDVPEDISSSIMENSSFYEGVETKVVPVRTYTDGTLAPHILGMVGSIDAEEYSELKEKGYKMNDTVGKSGIELAMEDYLKGTDGEETIYTDDEGNRTSEVTKEPEQGNTVVLTIDSNMQKVAQDALKSALEDYAGTVGNQVPNAGAVVVLSCKDSSILACASYPTYDISTYAENAEELNKATGSPLWNRALMSTYATGSTAKPSVAIAALEEGIIDEDYTVYCNGSYTYLGQTFKCEQAHATAFVNVVNAIDESCNTFFMEVGRLLGIEKMNEYRNLLGLGSKTGCELNEATGVLDSPEYRSTLGQDWLPGYTVQSAIGQAGNLWTPIQLANYVNTIANGGTRYRTHFVKSIKNADYTETILENKAEVVCETGISEETLDIVKRGMREVGVTGYCARYFSHLPVEVACKTGTSQEYRKINGVSTKINNGFLIAFAPYDDPQIAIAVVGEGMVSGVYVAPVVAAIVEYYCGLSDSSPEIQTEGQLIP
jgi:penicillin-binding protein 2